MSDSASSGWMTSLSTSTGRSAAFVTLVALGSSIATAAAIFGTQRLTRKKKRQDLADAIIKAANAQGTDRLQRLDLHARDEASSSTDGGTPRYLSGIQSNTLRPNSHLRNSTSFMSNGSVHVPTAAAAAAPQSLDHSHKRQPTAEQWDESLIREQLSRNYSFLGDAGMDAIRKSFVIVVGAGGVGSWAALMLLRSGVSKIRLIDFDQVSLSSLNRHACATLEDVGRPKVVCCAEKFVQIAPWAKLEAWVELFRGDEAERLLGGNPTYVVDAIDNIDTKVDLLRFCAERKIKVISSMGAGAKSDPSRIQISDISVTSEDPLARSVRRRLRALGIPPIPPKDVEERAKQEAHELEKKAQAQSKQQVKKNALVPPPHKGKSLPRPVIDLEKTPMKPSASSEFVPKTDKANDLTGPPRSMASSPSPLGSRNASNTDLTSLSLGKGSSMRPAAPRHSRRASSVSSMGSGVYATPLSTPSDEMALLLPGEGDTSHGSDTSLRALEDEDAPEETHQLPTMPSREFDLEPLSEAMVRRVSHDTISSDATAVDLSAHTAFPISAVKEPALGKGRQMSQVEELSPSPSLSRSTSQKMSAASTPPSLSRSNTSKHPTPTTEMSETGFFIPCVYSTEKSDTRLLPLDEDEFDRGNVDELAALEDFRVRILPVLGPLPAMFGLAVATFILCEIGGQKMEPLAFKGRRKMYEKMYHDLSVSEMRHPIAGVGVSGEGRGGIAFNLNDVAYLFEEVFRGRSVVPPYESLSGAQLERWDSTLPLSFQNVALFSRPQAKIHQSEVLKKNRSPVEVWGAQTNNMVKRRMASERRSGFFRF